MCKTKNSDISKDNNAKVSLYDTMVKEAREAIIECLERGYNGYYSELHDEVFNTEWYHDLNPADSQSKEEAKELLEGCMYEVIGRVYVYEKENFGEVLMDFENPAMLVNMLYYIIGEETLYCVNSELDLEFNKVLIENWDDESTDTINQKLLDIIKK